MSAPEHDFGAMEERVYELEEFCSSDELSLDGLRREFREIQRSPLGSGAIRRSSILRRICVNEQVTLEMVKHVVDAFPVLVSMKKVYESGDGVAYPLHDACSNHRCTTAIIHC